MQVGGSLLTLGDRGERLLDVNEALYTLAIREASENGVIDIVYGDNTYPVNTQATVIGYAAHRGYDLVTGIGTIYAPAFVPALAGSAR